MHARGLQPFNASCSMQGREASDSNLSPAIKPTNSPNTKNLNQEVSSFWAYLPYASGIMCMRRDNEHKSNPKRLINRTTIYK